MAGRGAAIGIARPWLLYLRDRTNDARLGVVTFYICLYLRSDTAGLRARLARDRYPSEKRVKPRFRRSSKAGTLQAPAHCSTMKQEQCRAKAEHFLAMVSQFGRHRTIGLMLETGRD